MLVHQSDEGGDGLLVLELPNVLVVFRHDVPHSVDTIEVVVLDIAIEEGAVGSSVNRYLGSNGGRGYLVRIIIFFVHQCSSKQT